MDHLIMQYANGDQLILTTDSPASHYGIPALQYTGCACPDMGPADQLCEHAYPQEVIDFFGERTAAAAVVQARSHLPRRETTEAWDAQAQCWVYTDHDPAAEVKAFLKAFCQQWPDGPQP